MKKIVCSLLAGAMMLSAMPCMAANVNITINGEEFIPKNALGEVVEPFILNGSTYLPVRAMGEAVGKTVSFDPETYSVFIGEAIDASNVKEPYALVGDRIYSVEDVEYLGTINSLVQVEQICKLAEGKLDKALIDKKYEEYKAEYSQWGMELHEGQERWLYTSACIALLLENWELSDEAFNGYVTVKHILVGDRETAEMVFDKVMAGGDFDLLIEEYNIDPGQTKDSSYTFTKGEMVEEFEKASFALPENEVALVASNYGYHIIKRLPLNKEGVPADNIIQNEITQAIGAVDIGKSVEMTTEGAYAIVDNSSYTSGELGAFAKVIMGEESVEGGLYYLESFVAMDKMASENSLVTEEELIEEIMTLELYGYSFDDVEDETKANYFMRLVAVYSIVMTKVDEGIYSDEILELWTEKEAKIESKILNKLKVFVDGKLIVPCDVNGKYVEPKNIDGTVYVPVRAIVEALGMSADWDNNARCVVITK